MLCDTIHILRQKRGVSTGELAAAIGVSTAAVEQYEANRWLPGLPTLRNMAHYFDVSLESILAGLSVGYDEENREILLIQNLSGNRIKIIAKVRDGLD